MDPSGIEKKYDLGTTTSGRVITLDMSDEVLLDGTWIQMPARSRVRSQGSKQLHVFKFRIPRFAASAFYDPLIHDLGSYL